MTKLTSIQEKALPYLLQNIIGISRTGTGKTLAYILPILQFLLKKAKRSFALIVVPTTDLVNQIVTTLKMFYSLGISVGSLIERVDCINCHLLVGTPGSLRKYIKKIKYLKIIVLDEVDKLFIKDYEKDMLMKMNHFNIENNDEICNSDIELKVENNK